MTTKEIKAKYKEYLEWTISSNLRDFYQGIKNIQRQNTGYNSHFIIYMIAIIRNNLK